MILSKNSIDADSFFGLARDLTLEKQHALEIDRLNQTLQRKNVVLTAANKVGNVYYKAESKEISLSSSAYRIKDLKTLQVMTQTFMNLSQSQACCLSEVTYEEDQPSLGEAQWYGSYNVAQQQKLRPLLDKFTQESLNTKKPLYLRHFFDTYSGLVLPLPIDEAKFSGFMVLLNNTGQNYTPELVDWLSPLTEKSSRILEDMALQRWKREVEKELEDRRVTELKLEQATRQKAEESNCVKTSFVSHMSHEIRTPLNSIMGFLELAQEEANLNQIKEYLSHASKSAKSLLMIANDILDMSRIESQTLILQIKNFNIHQLVHRVIQQSTLEAQNQDVSLDLTIDSSVPQLLKGDALRLQQILSNLISNAFKFTPKGTIKVHLEGIAESDIFHLKEQVQDPGIGMDDNICAQLFQPFSQGDTKLMRQFGGIGLGLYITKQLCERMKGTITAFSQPEVGSTFTFKVQLERTAPPTKLSSSEDLVRVSTSLPNLSVLVAGDNLMGQKVMRFLLEKMGCQVDIVVNGQEAIKATQHKNYDVILMDGEMPVMDGLEATRRLRAQSSTKFIPIIGVSAHVMPAHAHMFLDSGMNGYLAKPVNMKTLAAEIQRCLALQND